EISSSLIEKRYIRKNGVPVWVRVFMSLVRGPHNEPYLVRVVEDISEKIRAEEERQKFVSLADSSLEFIGMCNLDFQPFYVNAAGLRLLGLDNVEEALRVKVQDCFFPEDQPFITNEFFPRVLRDGHGKVEIRFRHFKTGEAIWMIYNVFNIGDA